MEFVHEWEYEGEIIRFSWLGEVDVEPDRVYAFAFTPNHEMLLVTDARTAPSCSQVVALSPVRRPSRQFRVN